MLLLYHACLNRNLSTKPNFDRKWGLTKANQA
jgi:hypothetical protein